MEEKGSNVRQNGDYMKDKKRCIYLVISHARCQQILPDLLFLRRRFGCGINRAGAKMSVVR